MPQNAFYFFFSVSGQYHLRIENAQLEDDTFYECQAGQSDTSEGIISNAVWLDVLSKKRFQQ